LPKPVDFSFLCGLACGLPMLTDWRNATGPGYVGGKRRQICAPEIVGLL
jgi:hypothetical protein